MTVERRDVERIAELARLRLGAAELDRFTVQLNGILGHMDQLAELDAEAAEAEAQAAPEIGAPLRADEGKPDALRRPVAEIATDWRHGFFVVPRLASQDRLAEGGDASALEGIDGA
ncbi:MAG TPA: Asp-tRNA(Asn)/Glu-tRNA(Gln) amidotransferase subunit GatC [Longimicrobiales bacterium]|nr:Asp-tRNA(Asn)/Glu-tRNA(Gln) amidotransferase subunit GatC [Longimicrobiales bacterium]